MSSYVAQKPDEEIAEAQTEQAEHLRASQQPGQTAQSESQTVDL